MTAPIKVSFVALETAAADITKSASTITGRLDQLHTDLAPMVATWEGEAAINYQTTQRQWDTAAAEMSVILDQIGIALRKAGENYRQRELQVSNSWRG